MKKLLLLLFMYILCLFQPAFCEDEEILIVFDASISMGENFYGETKNIAAINATKQLLDRLGNTKKVGLRTIGISLDASILNYIQNPESMCKATRLNVPIRTNNVDYIKNSLNDVFPLGTTPLEYSLDLSLNSDFSKSPNVIKHLILVTDGADSCNGDLCHFIRRISNSRKDVLIDIIAIDVSEEDLQQLMCLTSNTNGILYRVNNPSELSSAFDSTYDRIYNPPAAIYNMQEQLKPQGIIKYKSYGFQFTN